MIVLGWFSWKYRQSQGFDADRFVRNWSQEKEVKELGEEEEKEEKPVLRVRFLSHCYKQRGLILSW